MTLNNYWYTGRGQHATVRDGELDLAVNATGIYSGDGSFIIEGGTYYPRGASYAFSELSGSSITGGSIISEMPLSSSISHFVPEGYVLAESLSGNGYIYTVDKRYPIYVGGVGMEEGDYLPSGNDKTRADITQSMRSLLCGR